MLLPRLKKSFLIILFASPKAENFFQRVREASGQLLLHQYFVIGVPVRHKHTVCVLSGHKRCPCVCRSDKEQQVACATDDAIDARASFRHVHTQ